MRIIAGSKKGMKLLSPPTDTTRPIIDRIKEAIFSVLYKYDVIEGKNTADLFCGTGSFGLEALSRGAEKALFVDTNQKVISTLHKNIEKARFENRSKVIKANAFKVGAPVGFEQKKYSAVFVDPPYILARQTDADSDLAGLLDMLAKQIEPNAVIVVRTEKNINLLQSYGNLAVIDRRIWGKMAVSFLRLQDNS